jgi:hypothetical protein
MAKIVAANHEEQRSCFQLLLRILCWIKVIPMWQNSNKFTILSMPSLLATFWCWIPLGCLTYSYYLVLNLYAVGTNVANATEMNLDQTTPAADQVMDIYLYLAFLLLLFLLILILPGVLGHFFSLNKQAILQLKFCWPLHCWMLVSSTIGFILGETICQLFYSDLSTSALYFITSSELVYFTAAFLQFTALFLIGVRLTNFIETAAANSIKTITANTIQNLFEEYEKIQQGLGPLLAFLFCIHTPVILCISYFVLTYLKATPAAIWHIGSVFWSCLTLIYVCLMAEGSYDAVQAGVEIWQFLPTLNFHFLKKWFKKSKFHIQNSVTVDLNI